MLGIDSETNLKVSSQTCKFHRKKMNDKEDNQTICACTFILHIAM